MIRLFQPERALGLASASPSCMKLEAWLRINQIEYELALADLRAAPKGKVPYIEHDGRLIGDSTLIIDYLTRTLGVDPDAHLDAAQRAIALAFRRMMKEQFYWVIIHERWAVDEAFAVYGPSVARAFFPALSEEEQRKLITSYREVIKAQLNGQGMGRHTPEEVRQLGVQDVNAVADFLGDKPFFMGARPSTVDATVFAYMANILMIPLASRVKDAGRERGNLVRYLERMHARLFPELREGETA